AWYGHLRWIGEKKWLNAGLFLVVVICWGMAFFESCL
ncbi:MAG: DMT family protein, partial [Bacteroidota bacterium]